MPRNSLMPQMQLYDAPAGPNINTFLNPLMAGIKRGDEQRQQGFQNDRALTAESRQGEELQLAKNADARAASSAANVQKDRMTKNFGNMMLAIVNEPDEAKAQSYWQRIKTMPDFAQEAAAAGYDLNDHRGTSRLLAAKAGVLPDPLERQKMELGIQAQRGQIAVTGAQLTQLKSQSPEYRASVAEQYGMTKGTPTYNAFVISGQYSPDTTKFQVIPEGASVLSENPRTGQAQVIHQGTSKVDSTSRKAIFEAQDELPNLKAAVDQLNEAKGLVDSIYTGYGSQARSNFNQGAPGMLPNIISDPARAKATQRYNQIMGAEGIGAMSQTLKGATTDFEMRSFMNLMNDPNQSPDTKKKALDYMQRKAQAYYQNKVDRIRELGGRMPSDGVSTPGAAASGAADPLGIR